MRRLILTHRTVAALVLAAALAMRLLVPAGFMPDVAGGAVRLILCPAAGPVPAAMSPMAHGSMAMPMGHAGTDNHVASAHDHGAHDHDKSSSHDHAPQDAPCAFAGLALASLMPVDPVLLLAAIAFAMALAAFGLALPTPGRVPYLRPPLRGPPIVA
ncbi:MULTISPECIES: hypothetical protein [unclassified Sphingomonas]|uniref:hypothetical protein n=1 Tax=unclassified Sphingomonas TaxID=196159 RepID=UPI001E32DB0D|nr:MULTISPECIES: hypothetical protein [unclassified Sphingomonas]